MRELIWCTGDWIEAKREQAVVELGRCHDIRDGAMKQADDLLRCSRRRHKPGNDIRLKADAGRSAMVGTSGNSGERLAPISASARTLPALA